MQLPLHWVPECSTPTGTLPGPSSQVGLTELVQMTPCGTSEELLANATAPPTPIVTCEGDQATGVVPPYPPPVAFTVGVVSQLAIAGSTAGMTPSSRTRSRLRGLMGWIRLSVRWAIESQVTE